MVRTVPKKRGGRGYNEQGTRPTAGTAFPFIVGRPAAPSLRKNHFTELRSPPNQMSQMKQNYAVCLSVTFDGENGGVRPRSARRNPSDGAERSFLARDGRFRVRR